jgi:peptidoglycan/LPS O-acetylase OafA/YrhL
VSAARSRVYNLSPFARPLSLHAAPATLLDRTLKNSTDGRIDDIEALRAIAVTITIFDHLLFLMPWNPSGLSHLYQWFNFWAGVDLFFAISGFVIAKSLFNQLDGTRDSITFWRGAIAFWIRRIYRIWPSSLLWMIIVVVLSVALRNTGLMQSPRQNFADLTAVVLQVANFHWAFCHATHREFCGDIGVWWSLSLEEQFYIVLPICAWIFKKRLAYFLGGVALLQLFLHREFPSFLWYVRTDAICLGVLLAYFTRTKIYRELRPTFLECRWLALPIVALAVVLLISLPENDSGKPVIVTFTTGLVALVSVALVFVASFNSDYIVRARMLKSIFLWVGSRSYSIYLIHLPAMIITRAIWYFIEPQGTVFAGNFFLRFFSVWFVLMLGLSELNYRLLEQPLRRKGRVVARRFQSCDAPISKGPQKVVAKNIHAPLDAG